jgi:predicted esterase
MSWKLRLLIAAAGVCVMPKSAIAISPSLDTLRSGTVTDTVRALSDTSQTYALYLPSTYDKARRWPVLFLMDPRGRALVPMRLFRAAAERYGYIVMSSYQTQSDGPIEPNDKAVNAMLSDVQSRFSADVHRFYFAGFSGTGRIAWYYGYSIPENVAGLIEVGAGLPTSDLLLQKSVAKTATPFAVFLSVGTTDFNYDEVRELDSRLDAFGIRHHIETFDGTHSWPPESVCTDAITWMQLQAMRDGRLVTNRAWIDSLFAASARSIDEIARTDAYAASMLYHQLAADFAGLRETNMAQVNATKLAESEAAKRTAKRISRLAADAQVFREREDTFYADFARSRSPLPTNELRSRLRLDELRDRARQTTDTSDALAAKRVLASVFVRASFYEPRRYLAQGDTLKALAMYALAQSIHQEDSQLCAERDRLYRSFAIRKSVPRELGCDRR